MPNSIGRRPVENTKIAIITTRLGGFDKPQSHYPQSLPADYYIYDAAPRSSITPRLQAKIPKCFGWQLYPGYDVYLWLDGNLRLKQSNTLAYLLGNLKDVVVLQHPERNTLWWEYRYNWRGLNNNAPSNYLTERYKNELLDEQIQIIKDDKDYTDDLLVNGGVFMYRNKPKVQQALKEWWYYISRYLVMDQLSWAYILKKNQLELSILPDNFHDLLDVGRHARHG